MLKNNNLIFYSGTANYFLHSKILRHINDLSGSEFYFDHMNMGKFPDSEEYDRLDKFEYIKNSHVILFYTVVTKRAFVQFLTNAWACKYQYGAKELTVVMPFMRYRRQDHEEEKYKNEIQRNRMFLHLMKSVGVDNIFL